LDTRALDRFLLPLLQDVDGRSRADDLDRIAQIARRLFSPPDEAERRAFELILRFHALGKWLDRVGNISRVALAVRGISERELQAAAAAIRRLDSPQSAAEKAVAAALLIDGAGVRGLADQFARARREGSSLVDVIRNAVADAYVPEWLPPEAESRLRKRREARRQVCRMILEELDGEA
jgi:hypothetical protein